MSLINSDPLLNKFDASAYINVEPATLDAWRYRQMGPAWLVIGKRSIRYRKSSLDSYLNSREINPVEKNCHE